MMHQLQQHDHPDAAGQRDHAADSALTLHELALIVRRRLWLIALILAVSVLTAAFLSGRTPRAWRATAELLLVQRAPVMTASSQGAASAPMVESLDTQVSLLQSRRVAERAAAAVGISGDRLQGATTIVPPREGDNVIDLSVEADSRAHAIQWADALCQAFVDYKKDIAQQNSQQTLASLEARVAKARAQMLDAQGKLVQFQQAHHMADVPAQKAAALAALASQQGVVAALKNDADAAAAKEAALESQLQRDNKAIQGAAGVSDPGLATSLQAQLNDLEIQRVHTAANYHNTFPGKLSTLDAQIAAVKARLKAAIQASGSPSLVARSADQDSYNRAHTDALASQAKLAAAAQQLQGLQSQAADLPAVAMQASRLTQDAEQASGLYQSLEAAASAAQLDRDSASGNVQVSEPAFAPADPFRPSRKRDLLVGAGVGLGLSLLALLLLEQADRSVRGAADVRRLVTGPVVGVLPQMTRAQSARVLAGETPPQLVETYNAARANLGLAMRLQTGKGIDEHQVILVSSAVAGEGKSLTASELAQSFARAGRVAILVDADMRRRPSPPNPRLRGAPDGAPGLAEVLAGDATVAEALRETDVYNFFVLPCGSAARNPMDLISQPRMAETVRALRDAADVIVIDTPPAAVVADALLLAPHADCILYVVGVGMVDSALAGDTAASLAAAAPKMQAYFVNRAPRQSRGAHNYSYYDRPVVSAPAGGGAGGGSGLPDHAASRTLLLERIQMPPRGTVVPDRGVIMPDRGAVVQAVSAADVPAAGLRVPPPEEAGGVRVLPAVGSRLVATDGPYLGQSFALAPDKPLAVGTLSDCDIVLTRDGTISRRHARIAPEAGGYVVYDEGSTNGTFVNDAPVTRRPLAVGDVLQIGASKFRYE